MRPRDDSMGEMVSAVWLDRGTADRLLSGALAPDDAPPGYTDVARLLRSVATPPTPRELASEGQAIAMAQTILGARPAALAKPARSGDARPNRRFRRAKVTGLVLVGVMFATSGLAVAGVLPDGVQSAASRVLDVVGIDAPDPTEDEDPTELQRPASGGEGISEIATSTESEGVDKGAEISEAASGGVSRAGDDHGPPEDPGGSADGERGRDRGKGAEVSEVASGGHGPGSSGGPPSP